MTITHSGIDGRNIRSLRREIMGWWEERGCNAAFVKLVGQEGVSEARVTGIPPGKTTQPWKFALDDIFYVLEGKGLTTVWGAEQSSRKTFEWQEHSLFLILDFPYQTGYIGIFLW